MSDLYWGMFTLYCKIIEDITTSSVLMCLILSVLPGGYAGGPLLWFPQFEPADESSPERKMQHTSFIVHSDCTRYRAKRK